MAASLVIEEERGTLKGWVHPHNGYYAGDFSRTTSGTAPWHAPAAPGLRPVVDAGGSAGR